MPRHEGRKKVEDFFKNRVIFTSTFNLRGPNVSQIINRHLHLMKNSPFLHNIFPDGLVLVAKKHHQNLKNLLLCADLYNIKHDLTDSVLHQYKPCGEKCDSCDNFVASQWHVVFNATGREYYVRWDSSCSIPNVVYMAYCKNCKKQSVVSTISRKPRLCKYESHIKKNGRSCNIVTHFICECCDEEILFKYLAFVIIDAVNTTSGLTRNQIEDLLL